MNIEKILDIGCVCAYVLLKMYNLCSLENSWLVIHPSPTKPESFSKKASSWIGEGFHLWMHINVASPLVLHIPTLSVYHGNIGEYGDRKILGMRNVKKHSGTGKTPSLWECSCPSSSFPTPKKLCLHGLRGIAKRYTPFWIPTQTLVSPSYLSPSLPEESWNIYQMDPLL
jgi:hypothetical protein